MISGSDFLPHGGLVEESRILGQCFGSVGWHSCLHQSEQDKRGDLRQTPRTGADLLNSSISMKEEKRGLITVDVTPFSSVDVEHSKVSLKDEGEECHEDVVAVFPGHDHLLEVHFWGRYKESSINSTLEVTFLHLRDGVGSGEGRLIEQNIIYLVQDS